MHLTSSLTGFMQCMLAIWLISPVPCNKELLIAKNIKAATNGKADYKMITRLRLMQLEQPAVLYFNGNESVFIYSKGAEGFVNQNTLTGNSDAPADGWYQDKIGSIFYKNFTKKELIIREIVWQQPYLTKEPVLPKMKWKILEEQKSIGKFTCQKAETDFRGRHYTAWFTPEIQVSDGPWKFYGLPGLILEVEDEKKEVRFEMVSVEIPFESNDIAPPANGKKISFEEYKQADKLEFEKVRKKFLSQNPDRGSTAEFKRVKPNLIERHFDE